jgi:hypothetical protein
MGKAGDEVYETLETGWPILSRAQKGLGPVGPFEILSIQVYYGQAGGCEFVQILHDRRWVGQTKKKLGRVVGVVSVLMEGELGFVNRVEPLGHLDLA